MNKVVFVDIDGVLVTHHTCRFVEVTTMARFDSRAIKQLNRIVELGKAEVVISSTWRLLYSKSELLDKFVREGFIGKFHEDWRTKELWTKRGEEVKEWLDRHPEVTHWVCIDDDTDFRHDSNLVKTDFFKEGLTYKEADKAIDILINKKMR